LFNRAFYTGLICKHQTRLAKCKRSSFFVTKERKVFKHRSTWVTSSSLTSFFVLSSFRKKGDDAAKNKSYKTFFSLSLTTKQNKLECFSLAKFFRVSLTFVIKARVYAHSAHDLTRKYQTNPKKFFQGKTL
jgi:hypothetical protein